MRRSLILLCWLGIATLATGCGHKPVGGADGVDAAYRAAENAVRMVGAPYRYGGSTPNGFDCSGLVYYSYSRAGVRLPRSTDGLRRSTLPIAQSSLRRGDLVFFNQQGKRGSHVGIYLGNDEFVHAPSSGKTVHISTFGDRYWQRHFAGARRVESD